MREMKCPVCSGEMPRELLRSKIFTCPTCKEPLRPKDFNPLLAIPGMACGYWLTFAVAERAGLKGNALFMVTIFLGPLLGGYVVSAVLGLALAWLFDLTPRLERDPSSRSDDVRVLHIDSPPTHPKEPE